MLLRVPSSQTAELAPAERLFAKVLVIAIRDAQQRKNERLRREALNWLWWVAPTVAERAQLPRPFRR